MKKKRRKREYEKERKRERERGGGRVENKRIGGKKINVVTLQLLHATIIFFHSRNCVWKETFTRCFRLCEMIR